jgi:hypothetical protein
VNDLHRFLALLFVMVGCAPESPPPALEVSEPWFVESAASAGIEFVCRSGHREKHLFPEILHGGIALLDLEPDGDLDLYLVQAAGGGNALYRNEGSGRFTDVSAGSGADDEGYGMGVAVGDWDGDGDPDLYVTNLEANTLLRNDGGTFSDVTESSATGDTRWGTSAAFLDYDADGDLDLFVTNYVSWSAASELDCYNDLGALDYCLPTNYGSPARDTLYRNDGGGRFRDVTAEAGMDVAFGNGLGVICGDFDGNGWTDVFVANDTMMNQLWLNRGDGTFAEESLLWGCAYDEHGKTKAGMGTTAADIDGDSDLDLVVVNLSGETNSFYLNDGAYFTDRAGAFGLTHASRPHTGFGVGFADFDHDGWLDLYVANGRVQMAPEPATDDPYAEANVLFRGGPERFAEVPGGGTAEELVATSRGAAFGDVDGDGAVDVVVANRDGPTHFLRNVAPRRGGWIRFDVRERHGGAALGATVTLRVGDQEVRRDVRSASSYCAASDAAVHLGLGGETGVRGVRVRWVDGQVDDFGDFEGERTVELRRAEEDAVADRAGES